MGLTLHLSEHDSICGIVKILVLLIFVALVCCSGGLSRNDINLKVTHFVKHRFQKIIEQKQVTSLHTCGGDGIHSTLIMEDQIWSPVASSWCH